MRKRTLTVALTVLVAAGVAAGAFAATQSGGDSQQAFINDVARRLHVSPAQLRSAFEQARLDQINAAVRAGRLSSTQAQALKQRIEHPGQIPFGAAPVPFGGPPVPFGGPPGGPGSWRHPMFFAPGIFGQLGNSTAASSYLGLTDEQLFKLVSSRKSLAQIAQARGKTVSGLERALIAATRSHLDQAVRAGHLSQAMERHILAALSQHVRMIVNASRPFGGPPHLRGWHGWPPPGAQLLPHR
jgi:AraC-like DNA-binding protein